MIKRTIRLVTRQSKLALWQAAFIKYRLETLYSHLTVELHPIITRGDKILDTTLFNNGGKGLFTQELETQLLSGEADLAVHSMKDVPAVHESGVEITTILQRFHAGDGLINNNHYTIQSLPKGARVGTASLRRQCQLLALRPDLECVSLRGNVDTRLQKLDRGDFDAIVLAIAGLERLGWIDRVQEYISFNDMLPAAGQGALGIECRSNDLEMKNIISVLDHLPTHYCVRAERALITALEGGCTAPIGSYAEIQGETLYLKGLVGQPNGQYILRAESRGALHEAQTIGYELAEKLNRMGAKEILSQHE